MVYIVRCLRYNEDILKTNALNDIKIMKLSSGNEEQKSNFNFNMLYKNDTLHLPLLPMQHREANVAMCVSFVQIK